MDIVARGLAVLFFCFFISGCAVSSQEKAKEYKAYNESPPKMCVKAPKEPQGLQNDLNPLHGQNQPSSPKAAEDPQNLLNSSMCFYGEADEDWKAGRSQDALDALDKAYVEIAKIDTDTGDIGKKKEDMRLKISRLVQEIHASRCKTINGSNCAIPLTLNEDVQRQINLLLGPQRKWFIRAYKRSGRFREDIAKEFKDAGLPEELSWLPLIESGFNTRALSRAHALGLWQLIPSTGCRFGLERNAWIDERMDPEKSTQAAITYLKDLHNIFGDWTTVLAAYNCGEGTVLKAIKEQKINYLDNFWDLYKKLPKESADFVPRFLAVLEIIKNPQKYNLDLSTPDEPLASEEVTLHKQIHLKSLAEELGVYYNELVELNPELRRDVTPDTTYKLRVPYGKADELLAKLDYLPAWSPPPPRLPYREKKERHPVRKKIVKKTTLKRSKVRHLAARRIKVKNVEAVRSKKHESPSVSRLARTRNKTKVHNVHNVHNVHAKAESHAAKLKIIKKPGKSVKRMVKNKEAIRRKESSGHKIEKRSKTRKASRYNRNERKASSHARGNKGHAPQKDL